VKKSLKPLRYAPFFAAAIAIAALSSPSMAAGMGKAMSQSQIEKSVLSQGYAKVIRMEMEDGLYEVTVKTKDGKRQHINVDPKTGKVLGEHKDGFFSD